MDDIKFDLRKKITEDFRKTFLRASYAFVSVQFLRVAERGVSPPPVLSDPIHTLPSSYHQQLRYRLVIAPNLPVYVSSPAIACYNCDNVNHTCMRLTESQWLADQWLVT